MEHGGNLLKFGKRYQKREDEIIDFSSNANPLPIPPSIANAYRESLGDLARYPDPYAEPLCEKIAELFSFFSEQVIAGNGSFEILDLAIRTLLPKRALLIEPCFGEYRRLLQLAGAKVDHVVLKPEEGFAFPLEKILEHFNQTQLLILCHPNNPTGNAIEKDKLHFLLNEAKRKGVFVIADEAFVDWTPEISMASLAKDSEHLLIVRSMTKFFALAGIRSGFALGSKRMIRAMKERQGPWACNRIAQKISFAALDDHHFQIKSRQWLKEEKAWVAQAFRELEMFQVFPSLANFFLIQSHKPLVDFYDFLGQRGIYVRSAADYLGLDDSYFRIGVRLREDNQKLIKALSEWIYSHEKTHDQPAVVSSR
ncbi:MAG: threonine-phosphate decarboxylase [Omnitrophica bacterium RIFCSPHIGHO2_02_FULL_46_11]|nr:MAG: threonine-phosphate decarboxylase [Omnitrophica bacterium RIFCSPLOWO2_01_FULL_45_10b]OGW86125.1 MAG: threonine-phosphate decarboxylase [Omnitrophica bacterium RIFCSPHIGHO2_02_FULL_46_11]